MAKFKSMNKPEDINDPECGFVRIQKNLYVRRHGPGEIDMAIVSDNGLNVLLHEEITLTQKIKAESGAPGRDVDFAVMVATRDEYLLPSEQWKLDEFLNHPSFARLVEEYRDELQRIAKSRRTAEPWNYVAPGRPLKELSRAAKLRRDVN